MSRKVLEEPARRGSHIFAIFCLDGPTEKYGNSYGDAHPDNSTLHTGAVRPYTGFLGTRNKTIHMKYKFMLRVEVSSVSCSRLA
jgi:hypothetical protein